MACALKMSKSRSRDSETDSARLRKRNTHDAVRKNPLLSMLSDHSCEIDEFNYTNHKQWEELQSVQSCMKVFENWYNSNNKRYNHIKHAFNSLCKHYKALKFKHIRVLSQGAEIAAMWTFKSFGDKTWVYLVDEGDLELIAHSEGDVLFTMYDDDLKPIARKIKQLCA